MYCFSTPGLSGCNSIVFLDITMGGQLFLWNLLVRPTRLFYSIMSSCEIPILLNDIWYAILSSSITPTWAFVFPPIIRKSYFGKVCQANIGVDRNVSANLCRENVLVNTRWWSVEGWCRSLLRWIHNFLMSTFRDSGLVNMPTSPMTVPVEFF